MEETLQPLWKTYAQSIKHYLHSKNLYPDVQRQPPMFSFMPAASRSHPGTGHLWKSWLCSLCTLPFEHNLKNPPAPPGWTGDLLTGDVFLWYFHGLSLDSLQYVHVPVLGSPELDPAFQKGKDCLPPCAGNSPPSALLLDCFSSCLAPSMKLFPPRCRTLNFPLFH